MPGTSSFSCPGCGAPLRVENRFSKMVICQYCGQTAVVSAAGLDPAGAAPVLADFPSILSVGAQGLLRGEEFRCLGRLRYKYDEGFWDEWFLTTAAGRQVWLHEDEGVFVSFEKKGITAPLPAWKDIAVGSIVPVNQLSVFVVEKGRAVIAGGEGELSFRVSPGERIDYVDGTAEGQLVSIEFSTNEISLSQGGEVDLSSLQVRSG